jgi:hypothetical protein
MLILTAKYKKIINKPIQYGKAINLLLKRKFTRKVNKTRGGE